MTTDFRKVNEDTWASTDGRFSVSYEWRRNGGWQWILRDALHQLGPLGRGFTSIKRARAFADRRAQDMPADNG